MPAVALKNIFAEFKAHFFGIFRAYAASEAMEQVIDAVVFKHYCGATQADELKS